MGRSPRTWPRCTARRCRSRRSPRSPTGWWRAWRNGRAGHWTVYAVIFIDAINVKIREGQVANRPIYLALGVTVDGERDVLGLWAGEHGDGEGAKYWLRVCPRSRTAVSGMCACWSATG